jgi:hypothetical protein
VTSRFHFHLLAASAGARGIAVGMKKGYYDVKHESLVSLGSGWSLALGGPGPVDSAPDSGDAGILSQRGSLRDELPALAARKRAEAEQIYPPLSDRAGSPTSGSLTAGAARLFNKALAAPRKNKIRPGAL